MPKVALYNIQGEAVGEVELDDRVFGVPVNQDLMHDAVVMYLANQRQGTHATKTRSLVRGGGRKPWRQKGTGRARQGSIRAPHWPGGGIVFGPQPRDYSYTMPKKARRNALKSALSAKAQGGTLRVIDQLSLPDPKTREMATVLRHLEADGKSLVVTAGHDVIIYKSARNIPGIKTLAAVDLNVYDVLNHEHLVMTQDAVRRVVEVLAR